MFSGPRVASIGWVQGKAYVGVMRRAARSSAERGYYLTDFLIERGTGPSESQTFPTTTCHSPQVKQNATNILHNFSVWFVMPFIVCVPFRTLSQQKPLARR